MFVMFSQDELLNSGLDYSSFVLGNSFVTCKPQSLKHQVARSCFTNFTDLVKMFGHGSTLSLYECLMN